MSYRFKPHELTSEKSLWDVYCLTRKIHPSRLQLAILIISIIGLAINAIWFTENKYRLVIDIRGWSASGFILSITTLGFLIGGFTIFVTLAKPEMMLAMMDHQDDETKLPTLKLNLAKFMHVFIIYLICSTLYLSVVLFGQPNSIISSLTNFAPNPGLLKRTIIVFAYIYIGTSFVYLILTLKSFIYNIYAIVMNFLRWERERFGNQWKD